MSRIRIDRRTFLARIEFGAGLSLLWPAVFAVALRPADGDFADSSIKIPTGRDPVPGMPA